MPNSKQIVYLSQAQYAELIANGTITVDGVTVTYDENDIYVTPQAEPVTDVRVNGASITNSGVANIPKASLTDLGVIKVNSSYGLSMRSDGGIQLYTAPSSDIKRANGDNRAISPYHQHESVYYGLSKLAGVDLANESVTFGAYPDASKAAIQHMLGTDTIIAPNETDPFTSAHAIGELFTMNGKLYRAKTAIAVADAVNVGTNCEEVSVAGAVPHDVQVNGVSVVSNGVANVPIADTNVSGTVRIISTYGIGRFNNDGLMYVVTSSSSMNKSGSNTYRPITPSNQHEAAFYGLAKAAGDTTQSSSSNAVGTYTDNAKASIKSMLGIVDGSTSTVSVTGTTPSIAAVENTRYTCGEVSTLTITPPASGICIVRFTSGTTPTVLTATGVVWPAWFDATDLEADTVYEICITDGYGAVMSWAL